MEMDELEQRLNKILLDSQPGSNTAEPTRNNHFYIENCASEEQRTKDRTEKIIAEAEALKKQVDEAKKEIEERKAAMARRRADLASAAQGIVARRKRGVEETQKQIRMDKYQWNRDHDAMAHYRAALCTEVAKLYRLQRVRTRGNAQRPEYRIGGIDVVDLRHLNTASPELISASLTHIAHLLWLASHYLAIRLPAEITLPHNDYPRPTIFSLASSYNHGQVPFPGTSPYPPDGQDCGSNVPHPRPLFLDKRLSALSKEDSKTYNSFLEGVSLLSYNIVWLCRTQGISVGSADNNNASFDDFANMGRNLYNLLIGSSLQCNQLGQPLIPNANTSSASRNGATANSGEATNDLSKATPRMGSWSHGTTHTFLSTAAGQDFTKSFKLPNPKQLTDKLKALLVNETPNADWEVISDEDFGPNDLDEGVLVGGTPQSSTKAPRFGLESYMSVNTVRRGGTEVLRIPESNTAGKDKEKSTSGWTKIKPR